MIAKFDKEWLTVEEAASFLERSPQTIYGWVEDGVLASRKMIRNGLKKPRIRIHRDDVAALQTRLASGLPARA